MAPPDRALGCVEPAENSRKDYCEGVSLESVWADRIWHAAPGTDPARWGKGH